MSDHPNRRLDSWKEIAEYFGRDIRTVVRWEKERALPTRRIPGGGKVFAYTSDLDLWMAGENVRTSPAGVAIVEGSDASETETVVSRPRARRWSSPAVVVSAAVGFAILAVALVLFGVWLGRSSHGTTAPLTRVTPFAPLVTDMFARTDLALGSAYDVKAVDLNHDGKLDLVVSVADSDKIAILLGEGNGRFIAKTELATAARPWRAAIADFNGDGFLDVANTNYEANSITVWFGRGDATFTGRIDYPVGNTPIGIEAGDFNRDGHADLLVADWGSGGLTLLLNDGKGKFTRTDLPVGPKPAYLSLADFNEDGKPDIAVTHYTESSEGEVSLLLGNGDGTFRLDRHYVTGAGPAGVVAADFNADHHLDLAIGQFGAGVIVMLGKGDGSFAPQREFQARNAPMFLAATDINNDGKLDLIVANCHSSSISILLGKGDGSFEAQKESAVGNYPVAVAVGDFNGDRAPDLAVAATWERSISVLIRNNPTNSPMPIAPQNKPRK